VLKPLCRRERRRRLLFGGRGFGVRRLGGVRFGGSRQRVFETSQQGANLRGRLRPTDEVALYLGAALGANLGKLFGGLDALGKGGDAEIFTEANDRADDGRR
jgi:hypothetical protein